MDVAALLPFVDLGVTALGIIALIFAGVRLAPKWMEQKAAERAAVMQIAAQFGERIAKAQERQADAIATLAEHQAHHNGATIESFDALQIAISSVDSRVATLSGRLSNTERDVHEIKTQGDVTKPLLDEILTHVKRG